MYDKRLCKFVYASVNSVAQQPGFYGSETERELNELVERPANAVLKKLRAGATIGASERTTLTLYIGTMMMRVPRKRRKALELIPGVIQTTINEVAASLVEWAQRTGADDRRIEKRIADLESLKERYRQEVPIKLLQQVRDPWPTRRVLECIGLMTWRIISAAGVGHFLTSDNPAFFFEDLGLGNADSEVTFPLASDLALIANWQGTPGETIFLKATPKHRQILREVNRRAASGAERFVFYHEEQEWVRIVSDKRNPSLNLIRWQ